MRQCGLEGSVGGRYAQSATMAEVGAARNGGLCKSMSRGEVACLGWREPSQRTLTLSTRYREHSMATNSSVLAPTGMAPVISSRSTLRNEVACVNSRERQ